MTMMAGICFLLSLAFGLASVVNYFCIEGKTLADERSDAAVLTGLLGMLSVGFFVGSFWFGIVAVARGLM